MRGRRSTVPYNEDSSPQTDRERGTRFTSSCAWLPGQTRSCRDLWRQGRVVPHNKKQNKKKQLHRFVLLLPCHICQCGVMDDIFKPHVSYKKTERVITKKDVLEIKTKDISLMRNVHFFCLLQVFEFVHLVSHVRVTQGFLLYLKKKKKSHYSCRFHSLVALLSGSSCMCRSVWGLLLQCLIGMKKPADARASVGSGEVAERRRVFFVSLFKKENPENLEGCLYEAAGVLQGQLHRCQVCVLPISSKFQQKGGRTEMIPIQREQPL